jgi:hypothetical protein
VRGGTIVIKVGRYDEAARQVAQAARSAGADILDARTEITHKGRKHGWMRLRFPARRLAELRPAIHQAGTLYAENLRTDERISEYEDLERRVNRLREHQERLALLLESGRKLRGSDILYVQERLFRAGVDEGMLRQRRLEIARAAQTSTLVVEMFEPEPALRAIERARIDLSGWFAAGVARARFARSRFLARGATALAYALVWAPLWLPLLVVALALLRWLVRWLWRRRILLTRLWVTLAREVAELRGRRRERAATIAAAPSAAP